MDFLNVKPPYYQTVETVNRRRNGGVAFYVSQGISLDKSRKMTSHEMHIVTILCENSSKKSFLTVVNKLPQVYNCKCLDQLQDYLFGFKMQPEEMLTVCGDMNVDVSKSRSDSKS